MWTRHLLVKMGAINWSSKTIQSFYTPFPRITNRLDKVEIFQKEIGPCKSECLNGVRLYAWERGKEYTDLKKNVFLGK